MRNLLITTLVALGLSFSANAGELVFNASGLGIGSNGGTSGGFTINDLEGPGGAALDNSPWAIGGEYYKSMSDAFQIGGRLGIARFDTGAVGEKTQITLAALGRFNFGDELNTSMFAFGGVSVIEGLQGADQGLTSLHLGFGKRFSLAENITWQPNVEIQMVLDGDSLDEGMVINLNILSFGGFVNLF